MCSAVRTQHLQPQAYVLWFRTQGEGLFEQSLSLPPSPPVETNPQLTNRTTHATRGLNMPAHLSNEEFLSSLSNLLSSTSQKSRGSVFLTQKPLPISPAPAAAATAADASQEEQRQQQQPQKPAILIRATDGNTNAPNPKTNKNNDPKFKSKTNKKKETETPKVKISTIVAPEDLEAFYARYAEVSKAGMSGLKKRDRKKGKAKAKGGQAKVTKP
ncbi:hypothetical protein VTN00DRAFT_2333 [Thermoascus crustaceus]|uniref:uncharacterized protein n=1 Tax=Thermoascus crustaceus TaxID=5088 RepID=UPI00374244DC